MNNEPVVLIDKNTGKPRMEGFIQTDYDIPLYTQQYERPHNTVLVPCDKLAEMQAEIEALKAQNKFFKDLMGDVEILRKVQNDTN